MAPRLIEGDVMDDDKDTKIAVLEQEIDELRDELRAAKAELRVLKDETGRAVAGVRRTLSPLFNVMKQLFGEMDTIGVVDEPQNTGTVAAATKTSAVWDAWKQRLPPSCGRVIDALLLHGELSAQQIIVAAKMSAGTLHGGTGVLARLNKAGLLDGGRGGKYSLKKL